LQAGFGATYREDGEVEDGGRSRLSTADGSLGIDLGQAGGVTVVARYARREASGFPESSGGLRLATTHLLESRNAVDRFVSASIADLPFMASGRIGMKASVSEREEDRDSPAIGPGPGGFVPATTVSSRFRRGVVGGNLQWEGIPFNSRALAGIEAWREDGLRDSVLRIGPGIAGSFRLERDTRAAFAQLDSEPWPGWRASLALRYDDVSAGEGRTSGSAGLSVKIGESSRTWVHWSDGFKPPSFFALGDALVGNPDLRDESSRNAEIGFETTGKPGTARVTAFSTRYRDLVDFDPVAFRMVNRTSAKIAGFETWVAFSISRGLRVEGAYTYQDVDLAEAGARLRNRPNHRASGSLAVSREGWSGRLVATYVGSTVDFSVPTGEVRLPGFATMDASVERRFGRWRAGLAFDNLLDKRYEQFVGYPAAGLRVRASVRAAFD
jgi:outer membrane receptor protein involved in Fe transport